MNQKTLGGILLILGLVLVVASLVLMLVIVPGMKQFPDDVDTTRVYDGSMEVLLVPQADGSLSFLRDIDVSLERHFYTEEVDGDKALVVEEQTLSMGEQSLVQLLKRHAIDRKSMMFLDPIPEAWADAEGIYQRGGLVLGWPIDSEKKDYDGWSDDYRAIVPLVFDSEEEYHGIDTYKYTAGSDAQPIDPEQVVAMGLPPAVPQAALSGLVGDIVPAEMKQFPANLDTTRSYTGSMAVLLAPQPDGSLSFLTDLTVDLERHIYAEDTADGLALVAEEQVLSTGGQPLAEVFKRQVIDRKTMEFAAEIPEAWADQDGLSPRAGLVMGWPIGTEKKDYDGWSDDYRAIVPLVFDSEVEYAGVNTYYFTSASDAQPIDPEQVVAMGLPPALPQEMLVGLISGMEGVSPVMSTAFPLLMEMAEWPDPIPLEYTYEYTAEYWVEPVSGALVDTHKVEIRKVTVPEDLLASLIEKIDGLPVPVDSEVIAQMLPITVYHLDYQGTEETVNAVATEAKATAALLTDPLGFFMTLAGWEDPVPLAYTYEYTGEYWVEPTTGVLIDTHKIETRKVTVSNEYLASLGEQLAAMSLPPEAVAGLLPMSVYQLDYSAIDQSIEDAKADADDAKSQIELFGSTLPIAGIVVGLVLAVGGWFLATRKAA
ncbi:MAG: DUF3068 domain-containing protein [Anaerolineae bacterium]|nr:DUF3068 domain-containing protein [Anaerolineae bacterium]